MFEDITHERIKEAAKVAAMRAAKVFEKVYLESLKEKPKENPEWQTNLCQVCPHKQQACLLQSCEIQRVVEMGIENARKEGAGQLRNKLIFNQYGMSVKSTAYAMHQYFLKLIQETQI